MSHDIHDKLGTSIIVTRATAVSLCHLSGVSLHVSAIDLGHHIQHKIFIDTTELRAVLN